MNRNETLTLGAVQCALGGSVDENVARVERLVREAAGKGARVVLPPELFEGPYFCREEDDLYFSWARPAEGHPTIERFQRLARDLSVAIPVSFFERSGPPTSTASRWWTRTARFSASTGKATSPTDRLRGEVLLPPR